eukprot:GHVT01094831.1.p4 GENE.GHVT01094831.1~~GHVT01094831.1.p4  ORF type:complete len:114 (+),score=22.83 GHVT01094831.1:363-704(+)
MTLKLPVWPRKVVGKHQRIYDASATNLSKECARGVFGEFFLGGEEHGQVEAVAVVGDEPDGLALREVPAHVRRPLGPGLHGRADVYPCAAPTKSEGADTGKKSPAAVGKTPTA